MEIRAHARLAAPAWICAPWDQAEVSRLHRGAGRICRHTNVVNRPRVNHGRGGSHIQEDIVVGRIIRDAITAADDRLVFPDQLLERSEEHTSELQSHSDLVCRLLLEKKKTA